MGADLLCGGLDGLLGERDDALDIDAAPLAEVGGEAQHPRADAGIGAGEARTTRCSRAGEADRKSTRLNSSHPV